jgi:hypothetical protein
VRGPHKRESSEASVRGGLISSSDEGSVMELEPRGQPGAGKEHQQRWTSAHDQNNKQHARIRVRVCVVLTPGRAV